MKNACILFIDCGYHFLVTAVTTTIGHSIKTLQHSTVYVTGSAVVFLVPPTTSASGRNLFSSSVAQSTKGI